MHTRHLYYQRVVLRCVGEETIFSAIGTIVLSVILFIVDSIAENAITDAVFSIIYQSADIASQYDPVSGALIRFIPLFIVAALTFAGLKPFCKLISRILAID